MPLCPTCRKPAPTDSYVCPDCGTAIPMDTSAPTEYGAASSSSPSQTVASGSSAPTTASRFAAGTILGGRYRIVSLLGRGGMGEVYRADDLTLDQAVALKFLPPEMAADPLRRERFYAEVRVAREVSHPNVCRVYDLGEIEGHHFLSMELIEGDDLAGLLRKVGRFPEDKALDLARQLCAGLAAAHKKGVIHRDLKPANVMIDARGQVRITDFGLAAIAGTIGQNEVVAGTPTYMAPEQLAGVEVTERSDLYALGLVLYELFTGRPVYEPATLAELRQLHSSATPSSLSIHVPQIDPAIDRVILRCLERDPKARPSSPLEIAAALPGGDPLAAALAAGETPSPEMVAAAGSEGTLPTAVSAGLAGGGVLLFLLACWMGLDTSVFGLYDWPKPPAYLAERAREIADRLEPDREVVDDDWGLQLLWGYFSHRMEEDSTAQRWSPLRQGEVSIGRVWYRSAPRRLDPRPGFSTVTPTKPPQVAAGDSVVTVDDRGRLREYSRVPPQHDERPLNDDEPDWSALFEEAGLDATLFEPVASTWTPHVSTDRRWAWLGPDPDSADGQRRIEAGAFRGEAIYFRVLDPWTRPGRGGNRQITTSQRVTGAIDLLLQVGLLLGGALMARRNVLLGRSDVTGAFRVSAAFLVIHTIVWAFWAHHAPLSELDAEWTIFQMDTGYNLFLAGMIWIFYVGLEPFVRRHWPEALISWTRLLNGRWNDPLVGRHVLIGVFGGSFVCLLARLSEQIPTWLGQAPGRPRGSYMAEDLWDGIAWVLDKPVHSLLSMMQALLLIVVLGLVLRRRVVAASLAGAVFVGLSTGGMTHLASGIPLIALAVGVVLWILLRHGLLAGTLAQSIVSMQSMIPLSRQLDAWHQATTWSALIGLLLLTFWAFRTTTGSTTTAARTLHA